MMGRLYQTRFSDWGEAIGASTVVHVAAAVFIFDLAGDLVNRTPPVPDAPPILVTSIILGSDTVTSATDEGEGDTTLADPGPNEAIGARPVAPETLAPVDPEETTAGNDPDSAEPLLPDSLMPLPADGSAAVEPSILRPANDINIATATVRGEGTAAVTPERVGAIQSTSVINTNSNTVRPENSGSGGDEVAGEVTELVRRIRAQLNDPCLLAFPEQTAAGVPELVMLGNTDTGMRGFANAILEGMSPRPSERSILVDNRQCDALNYIRQSEAYPAFRLTMTLDARTIESGENISGAIGNIGGRYVTLVLVDDNGVVQELGDYLSFRGGFARFDVPLNRAGNARDTSQVLIAFGSTARPRAVDAQNGQLAATYFEALRAELGPNTPMVMVPFSIR